MKHLAFLAALLATPVAADLAVAFDEGAPKDRFSFTNQAGCDLPALDITLDLTPAPAGLIFDVTGGGAGVEVFQPFEVVAGATRLTAMPTIADGDTALLMRLAALKAGETIAFTIDIDDTGGAREITVSGSEIAGAVVRVRVDGTTTTGTFSDQARALVPLAPCTS